MFEWLRNLLTSRYTLYLEDECARLRTENRLLTNSLLAVAGHTQVDFSGVPATTRRPRNLSLHQLQRKNERDSEQVIFARYATTKVHQETKPAVAGTSTTGKTT
jgi:hypothetical protein